MFDKNGFMGYLHENFSFNATTLWLIESVVDYGIKNFGHSKDGTSYFIYDIIRGIESIDIEEIEQFER